MVLHDQQGAIDGMLWIDLKMANKFKNCATHSWRSLGIFEKMMNDVSRILLSTKTSMWGRCKSDIGDHRRSKEPSY